MPNDVIDGVHALIETDNVICRERTF